MKRDMEAIRSLLLKMEEKPDFAFLSGELMEMIGGNPDHAAGLITLLYSGGYLESSQRGIYRMSWQGHEFLDTIRDPEIWRKTKEGAGKVGSWSVKLLADMATGFLRVKATELGLPIG